MQQIKNPSDLQIQTLKFRLVEFFAGKALNLRTNKGLKIDVIFSFNSLDRILGFSFHEGNLIVCSAELEYENDWKYSHFFIGEDLNFYATVEDSNEINKTFQI